MRSINKIDHQCKDRKEPEDDRGIQKKTFINNLYNLTNNTMGIEEAGLFCREKCPFLYSKHSHTLIIECVEVFMASVKARSFEIMEQNYGKTFIVSLKNRDKTDD